MTYERFLKAEGLVWIHKETKVLMSAYDYSHLSTIQKSKMKLYTKNQENDIRTISKNWIDLTKTR